MMRNLSIIICLTLASTCIAADWPQWRGPAFNGSSEQTGLPDKLNEDTLAWAKPLPGIGASTPVIADGRIYLTSIQDDTKNVLAICLDSKSGNTLWSKPIEIAARSPRRNNFASCSPVACAGGAVFMFGSGHIVRLDEKGQSVWQRNITDDYGSFASILFGYSASPLLHDDKLYIAVMRQHAPSAAENLRSFLLCLSTDDGKTIFRHTRDTDAVKEGHDAYTSPLPATIDGKPQIIVTGADYITAHDPATGKESWRYCYDPGHNSSGRLVPTPAIHNNLLAAVVVRGDKMLALDLQKAAAEKPAPEWSLQTPGADVASPTIYKGHAYFVNDRQKSLICRNLATGEEKWVGQLNKSDAYYASPTAADDKLYMVNRKGAVSVIAADSKEFKILSTSTYDEKFVDSTIVAADGRIFLRTAKNLYCFKTK